MITSSDFTALSLVLTHVSPLVLPAFLYCLLILIVELPCFCQPSPSATISWSPLTISKHFTQTFGPEVYCSMFPMEAILPTNTHILL